MLKSVLQYMFVYMCVPAALVLSAGNSLDFRTQVRFRITKGSLARKDLANKAHAIALARP
jgi:hypothetical protein